MFLNKGVGATSSGIFAACIKQMVPAVSGRAGVGRQGQAPHSLSSALRAAARVPLLLGPHWQLAAACSTCGWRLGSQPTCLPACLYGCLLSQDVGPLEFTLSLTLSN